MAMEGHGTPILSENQYQYNGKELNSDFGLDLYDYGARWYDASVGRWHGVDPLAEAFIVHSPYNYGVNNPIMMVDPDGRFPISPAEQDPGYVTTKVANHASSKAMTGFSNIGLDFSKREEMLDKETQEIEGKTISLYFPKSASEEFKNAIFGYIRKLYKTEGGKEIVDQIIYSELDFTVKEGETIENNSFKPVKNEDGIYTGGILTISLAEGEGDGVKFNGFYATTHEFFHAYQLSLGSEGYIAFANTMSDNGNVPLIELQAVGFSNSVRSELQEEGYSTMRIRYTINQRSWYLHEYTTWTGNFLTGYTYKAKSSKEFKSGNLWKGL
jgi:RHS repeat-associated protein